MLWIRWRSNDCIYIHARHRGRTLGPGPRGVGASLATQGCGYDLRGEVEEVSQVLDALVGQVPVEVAPGELLLDVPARLQGLERGSAVSIRSAPRGALGGRVASTDQFKLYFCGR